MGDHRACPDHLIADKGYSGLQVPTLSPLVAAATDTAHHSRATPERRDQRAQRAIRPGQPLRFDKAIYAHCHVVERCINRLKHLLK